MYLILPTNMGLSLFPNPYIRLYNKSAQDTAINIYKIPLLLILRLLKDYLSHFWGC